LLSCVSRNAQERTLMVVIEPQRYFAEAIADTAFSVESLVPKGLSPETYDPSPSQMMRLASASACIYTGNLGFETAWIDRLKKNNPKVRFFRNDSGIQLIENEESMHDHHHHSGDPHIWTSPRNALIMVDNIYKALCEISPENKDLYYTNLQKISEKIKQTDDLIATLLQNSKQKSFIIFHPSLTYFARDYGLHQYAIESEGKEPSPSQLARIIETARSENIRTLFVQAEFDQKNAEIIAAETGADIVEINPLSYQWHEEMLKIAKALSK